jgi:hypothetical protein
MNARRSNYPPPDPRPKGSPPSSFVQAMCLAPLPPEKVAPSVDVAPQTTIAPPTSNGGSDIVGACRAGGREIAVDIIHKGREWKKLRLTFDSPNTVRPFRQHFSSAETDALISILILGRDELVSQGGQ